MAMAYNPDHRQIYKFIRTLFNAAQLTAECAIITLVYLERLLTYAEVGISYQVLMWILGFQTSCQLLELTLLTDTIQTHFVIALSLGY